jgi:hypothetical protein
MSNYCSPPKFFKIIQNHELQNGELVSLLLPPKLIFDMYVFIFPLHVFLYFSVHADYSDQDMTKSVETNVSLV